ncbi:hypothetical protein NX059_009976 [Plenodomus lindquistii]|nr:hypothetical protein NX059_009976 [Plenodomus lindquistii]
MSPYAWAAADSESDSDTSRCSQTPSTSNTNTPPRISQKPAVESSSSVSDHIWDIEDSIANIKNTLARCRLGDHSKSRVSRLLRKLSVQLNEAQVKSASKASTLDGANTQRGWTVKEKDAIAAFSGTADDSRSSKASASSWSVAEDRGLQYKHNEKLVAGNVAHALRSLIQPQGDGLTQSPASTRAAVTSIITQAQAARPTVNDHNYKGDVNGCNYKGESSNMLPATSPHLESLWTVRQRKAAQPFGVWNNPSAAIHAPPVRPVFSDIQVCTRDHCYCANENTCPWLVGERHAHAKLQAYQPKLPMACCEPSPDHSMQEFMRILIGSGDQGISASHDRNDVVEGESGDRLAMTLTAALDALDVNDASRLTYRALSEKFTSCVADADNLSPEFATHLAKAFKTICMHLDDTDGWYKDFNWTLAMDNLLMDLKANDPTMSWADMAVRVNATADECKKRFHILKPKDWRPNLANTKSAQKKLVEGKKNKFVTAVTEKGCPETMTLEEPLWANPDATSQNGSDVRGTPAEDHRKTNGWECVEPTDTTGGAGAWGLDDTGGHGNGDASPWPTVPLHDCWESAPMREDTPAPIKTASVPYTVTYWVTIESGNQTVHIPIDARNISGPEKTIVESEIGMKKVWKWAQEKGLADRVGLEDAFDLAKSMHHKESDDDHSTTSAKNNGIFGGGDFDSDHEDPIPPRHRVDSGWGSGSVQSPYYPCGVNTGPGSCWKA